MKQRLLVVVRKLGCQRTASGAVRTHDQRTISLKYIRFRPGGIPAIRTLLEAEATKQYTLRAIFGQPAFGRGPGGRDTKFSCGQQASLIRAGLASGDNRVDAERFVHPACEHNSVGGLEIAQFTSWMRFGDTMTTMKVQGPATLDDLLQCPKDGRKYELVDGKIVVSPAGFHHAEIVIKIAYIIATFLDASPIGRVLGDNLGISFPNGNLRSPDVTFVSYEKLPAGESPEGFGQFIPDLAVEVLSPHDSLRHIGQKIGEFLESGVPLVWLVDPSRKTVTVYRSLSQTEQLSSVDILTAEPVLPGFSCLVSRFF